MGYKAAYEEVINGHRAFIARRRAPGGEYRTESKRSAATCSTASPRLNGPASSMLRSASAPGSCPGPWPASSTGRSHWHQRAAVQRTALAAATSLGDTRAQAISGRMLAAACARLGDYDQAEEIAEHLGREKHDPASAAARTAATAPTAETLFTDVGAVDPAVPQR